METTSGTDGASGRDRGILSAKLPNEGFRGKSDRKIETGLIPLSLGKGRDGLLYVPITHTNRTPAPLLVLLHGAGGEARGILSALHTLADESGLMILAPESRGRSWDVIMGSYGPDVEFIDRALEKVFRSYNISDAHLAIGGFSDGASYALSLGITNGAFFTHAIAFSPGFISPTRQEDSPRLFVSHGTDDRVLPIDHCSRKFVPKLQKADYDIQYLEFTGGHTIPDTVARQALTWFLTPIADKMGI